MKRTVKGKATVKVPFNETFEGKELSGDFYASFCVEAEHWHSPGRMYMRNGDPGYPEEDEYEILEVKDFEFVEFDGILELPEEEEKRFVDWLLAQENVKKEMRDAACNVDIDDVDFEEE